MSLPTLKAIAQQREWKGEPSTTQLLKGTREVFLELTKTYAIDPQSMIWAIFGTGVHSALDEHTGDNDLGEIRISDGTSSGSFDYYEPETGFLYDRKTYGSYKTAKLLGLYKVKIPIMGEDGEQRKYKNGKKMFEERFLIGRKSRLDVAIQLNDYRMKLESCGFAVNKQFVEVLTRDSGTFMAKSRGINENAQLVLVNKISDRWITRYMTAKANRLMNHLKTNTLPPPCSMRETWNGLKCSKFCHVWEHCDVGLQVRNGNGNLSEEEVL